MSAGGGHPLVASIEDLEEFSRLPESTRHLNPSLRGVLAEVAAMGIVRYAQSVILPLESPPPLLWIGGPSSLRPHDIAPCRRYSWPLLRPVLEVLLDNDIAEFEAFSRVEVCVALCICQRACQMHMLDRVSRAPAAHRLVQRRRRQTARLQRNCASDCEACCRTSRRRRRSLCSACARSSWSHRSSTPA